MNSEDDNEARICMSIQTKTQDEFIGVVKTINKRDDMHAIDLASNELAKSHLRHLAGGRPENVRFYIAQGEAIDKLLLIDPLACTM